MYRIMNQGARSFIFDIPGVLKGGVVVGKDCWINPGKEIIEVRDRVGKILERYHDILVIEKDLKEHPEVIADKTEGVDTVTADEHKLTLENLKEKEAENKDLKQRIAALEKQVNVGKKK